MNTPTPETDAETLDGYMPIHVSPEGKCYVPVDFARKLERERDGALELLGGYKMDLDEARERNLRLVNDNIVLTKDRDAWKAKAERVCVVTFIPYKVLGFGYFKHSCGALSDYDTLSHAFCTRCGGRIVKGGNHEHE